ncbi:trypco2 family protein [Streptomyces sp. NPDC049813]|uniref:trypco2 family protein n=1 Tax=Streptomyces sp. NPDC049813 TaxID=3365597 RepID=UPI0037A806BA
MRVPKRDDEVAAIDLAQAVQAVREGLTTAAAQGAGKEVTFELGDIQMEFTVEIRRDLKAGGKVKAWVVDAGADVSHGSGRTHKVAFTLKPQDARTGAAWRVAHDDEGNTEGFGRRSATER